MAAKVIPIRRKAISEGLNDVNDLIEGLGFDPHEDDGRTLEEVMEAVARKWENYVPPGRKK